MLALAGEWRRILVGIIKGKYVVITPFRLEDALKMTEWGFHENPLFSDYNFPLVSYESISKWYNRKTFGLNKKYFAIYNKENKLIGYLGIKNIKRILGQSTLGIVFDPNYINKGYGTDALGTFLGYYFNDLNMKCLYLEVAKFNKRAIKVYEKTGFVIIDEYLMDYHDQYIDLNNPYFQQERSAFVINRNKIYNYIYKMKIDKDIYDKLDVF